MALSAKTPAGLVVDELAFAYDRARVFSEIGFELGPGSYACLLGPSGSGKSTLLYAVAGVLRPSAGTIAIGGRTIVDATTFVPANERDLGMVFQDYSLWPHMTALENVAFPLRARKRPGAAARAAQLLKRMGLEALAQRHPEELSGGQKQRVALARALAAEPALVLLDEPLSALDATVRDELRAYLATLSREFGLTALHVTHDPDEAFYLADVVGIMLDGRLVQWDSPENVYRRPHDARVARITGLSSVIPVRCGAIRDGYADVVLAGLPLRVPVHPALRPSLMAALILRSDAVSIGGAQAGESLTATVRDCRFAGDRYVAEIVLSDGSEMTVPSNEPLPSHVAVCIRPEAAWLAPLGENHS